MVGAYATAAVIIAASVAIGQAIFVLAGRREFSWLSAPVGMAALITTSGLAIKLPGHSTAASIALVLLLVVSAVVLWKRGSAPGNVTAPLLAGGVALLLASLPFIAAGRVGILGVGLVNDDMAYHLLMADWIGSHAGHMPTLIHQGYPVGPHALVDGVTGILNTSLVNGFAGLTVALPALIAMVAAGALTAARPAWRLAVGALTAVAYLAAAYVAQEAFKEPIEALLLLGFALYLPWIRTVRDTLPSVVICAGVVYAYSFPGLFWLAGTVGVYWAIARPWETIRPFLIGHAFALILIAPEIGRLIDFSHFKAFSPSTANSGGLGNLRHQLSPAEAFGIWPTSEFRLAASDAGHPIAFYLGSLLAIGAFVAGVPRWVRRYGWGLPAAIASAALIYVVARISGTVYTSAKALAIASPLILLTGLGGLVSEKGEGEARRWMWPALAGLTGLVALASSFLVLRQAPIGPTTHADELATFKPVIGDRRVLFLGRDDFIQYELAPAKPYVAVHNYYDNYYVKPNLGLAGVFKKFDFDTVKVSDLARFKYVITTRGAYGSGPPPWFHPVKVTPSFVLWERGAVPTPPNRQILEEGDHPSAELPCGSDLSRTGGTAHVLAPPVTSSSWSGGPTVESGSQATTQVKLSAGKWDVSLQYDASRPVHLSAPGLSSTLPANLDYRGTTPFYAAGRIHVERAGPVSVSVSVEDPPLAGRLLGASSVAHLGSIAFTKVPTGSRGPSLPGSWDAAVPLRHACGRYVDWYSLARNR